MRRTFIVLLALSFVACAFKEAEVSPQCEEYCDLMAENCTTGFDDFEECAQACAEYPSEPDDLDPETGVAPNDDTVECRIYHANNAAAGKDGVHCTHARPEGGGVCVSTVPPCGEYCGVVVEFCAGEGGASTDTDECLETCNGLLRGMEDAVAGDTAHCRYTWAKTAKMNQDKSQCENAAFDSPVCAD